MNNPIIPKLETQQKYPLFYAEATKTINDIIEHITKERGVYSSNIEPDPKEHSIWLNTNDNKIYVSNGNYYYQLKDDVKIEDIIVTDANHQSGDTIDVYLKSNTVYNITNFKYDLYDITIKFYKDNPNDEGPYYIYCGNFDSIKFIGFNFKSTGTDYFVFPSFTTIIGDIITQIPIYENKEGIQITSNLNISDISVTDSTNSQYTISLLKTMNDNISKYTYIYIINNYEGYMSFTEVPLDITVDGNVYDNFLTLNEYFSKFTNESPNFFRNLYLENNNGIELIGNINNLFLLKNNNLLIDSDIDTTNIKNTYVIGDNQTISGFRYGNLFIDDDVKNINIERHNNNGNIYGFLYIGDNITNIDFIDYDVDIADCIIYGDNIKNITMFDGCSNYIILSDNINSINIINDIDGSYIQCTTDNYDNVINHLRKNNIEINKTVFVNKIRTFYKDENIKSIEFHNSINDYTGIVYKKLQEVSFKK